MSMLYKAALASYFSDELPYQSKWETDCNEKFTPEDWGTMLQNLRKATKSLAVREMAYKVLTRWYYTPSRPQMMFPGTSGLCFRGCQLPGTFRHIFWNCRLLSLVWKGVTAVVSAIAGTPLQLTVSMVLLGATIPGILRKEECLIHTICISTLWAIARSPLEDPRSAPTLHPRQGGYGYDNGEDFVYPTR